jgi:hypothetical protein
MTEAIGIKTLSSKVSNLEQRLSCIGVQDISTIESILNNLKAKERTVKLNEINDQIITNIQKDVSTKPSMKQFNQVVHRIVYYIEEYTPKISAIIGFAVAGQLKFELVCSLVTNFFQDICTDLLTSTIQDSHKTQFSKTKKSDNTTSYDFHRERVLEQATPTY